MRHVVAIALCAGLMAPMGSGPARAEEDGGDLMRRGLELFLEGLQDEVSPALRDFADLAGQAGPALQQFWQEMGPAFAELMGEVQDWTAYHPPEILPNGDIIIRRKTPADPPEPDSPAPKGQIDL